MKKDLGTQVLTINKSLHRYFFLRIKYNSVVIRVGIVIKLKKTDRKDNSIVTELVV